MIPVLTPEEMRAADARTIAAGTPESVLMARAGRAVAWQARRMLRGTYGRRVIVVAGQGNNGGDGRIAAAALARWGVRAQVVDCRAGPDRAAVRALARADLVVDAMFGTGFRGEIDGAPRAWIDAVADAGVRVLAVDIPSGVDGLTGAVSGAAVTADATVTFAAPKPGLWFHPGRARAGVVTVAEIGIDLGPDPTTTSVTEISDVAGVVADRDVTAHKWQSGVLVIGGSAGMTGAPMLAARAAMRSGAGIVWVALPGDGARQTSGTEVIAVSSGGGEVLEIDAVPRLLELAERFGAVVLGPGLGRAEPTMAAVHRLVAQCPAPLVVDADALVALGTDRRPLRRRSGPTVLTPHDGEFRHLAGAAPGPDRVAAARALAAESATTILLKGPTTLVASPGGRVRLNPTGGPALATAGSGDVLSGVIGAFCANGAPIADAAAAAAFVHGSAGEAGHTGLIATDLPGLVASVLGGLA